IRDFHVTGVQTCALPISNAVSSAGAISMNLTMPIRRSEPGSVGTWNVTMEPGSIDSITEIWVGIVISRTGYPNHSVAADNATVANGRASCRQRESFSYII